MDIYGLNLIGIVPHLSAHKKSVGCIACHSRLANRDLVSMVVVH